MWHLDFVFDVVLMLLDLMTRCRFDGMLYLDLMRCIYSVKVVMLFGFDVVLEWNFKKRLDFENGLNFENDLNFENWHNSKNGMN
jgi:hypothetical protein